MTERGLIGERKQMIQQCPTKPCGCSYVGEQLCPYYAGEVARVIRIHYYDTEDETCACISSNAESRSDITHMSIVEHSEHVADVILNNDARLT